MFLFIRLRGRPDITVIPVIDLRDEERETIDQGISTNLLSESTGSVSDGDGDINGVYERSHECNFIDLASHDDEDDYNNKRVSMCENRCPRDREEVGHNTASLIMDQCDIDDSIISLSGNETEMLQEHTVQKCKSAINNSNQQYKILLYPTFQNPEMFLYLDEVLDKILLM